MTAAAKTPCAASGLVVLKGLAATGLGFVAASYAVFLLAGLGSPVSLALSVPGLLGGLACVWGILALERRSGRIALAAGLLAILGTRGVRFAQGLPDVGIDDLGGALSVLGLLLALVHATLWAVGPEDAGETRARGVRLGFGIAAVGWSVTMLLALSFGSLPVVLGMLLGAVGFSLAAPNVVRETGERPSAAGPSA